MAPRDARECECHHRFRRAAHAPEKGNVRGNSEHAACTDAGGPAGIGGRRAASALRTMAWVCVRWQCLPTLRPQSCNCLREQSATAIGVEPQHISKSAFCSRSQTYAASSRVSFADEGRLKPRHDMSSATGKRPSVPGAWYIGSWWQG